MGNSRAAAQAHGTSCDWKRCNVQGVLKGHSRTAYEHTAAAPARMCEGVPPTCRSVRIMSQQCGHCYNDPCTSLLRYDKSCHHMGIELGVHANTVKTMVQTSPNTAPWAAGSVCRVENTMLQRACSMSVIASTKIGGVCLFSWHAGSCQTASN